MAEKIRAVTRITVEQDERWRLRSDELGYPSLSQFIGAMTESGLKKFDGSVVTKQTQDKGINTNDSISLELDAAHDEITQLQSQLAREGRDNIVEFVKKKDGPTYSEIVKHIIESTPARVTSQLEAILGDELIVDENGRYYIRERP